MEDIPLNMVRAKRSFLQEARMKRCSSLRGADVEDSLHLWGTVREA